MPFKDAIWGAAIYFLNYLLHTRAAARFSSQKRVLNKYRRRRFRRLPPFFPQISGTRIDARCATAPQLKTCRREEFCVEL